MKKLVNLTFALKRGKKKKEMLSGSLKVLQGAKCDIAISGGA